MARLLRSMPEISILINALFAAAGSVFYTILLLVSLLYVYAIGFVQLLRETSAGHLFRTVPAAMSTLLLRVSLLDNPHPVFDQVRANSLIGVVLLYFFLVMSFITIHNLLVGLICEVITAVAATERETILVKHVHSILMSCLNTSTQVKSRRLITREEFVKFLQNYDAIRALENLGIDTVDLIDSAHFIFEGEDGFAREVPMSDFLGMLLALRGSNTATVKDIVGLRKFIISACRGTGPSKTPSRPHLPSHDWASTEVMSI